MSSLNIQNLWGLVPATRENKTQEINLLLIKHCCITPPPLQPIHPSPPILSFEMNFPLFSPFLVCVLGWDEGGVAALRALELLPGVGSKL